MCWGSIDLISYLDFSSLLMSYDLMYEYGFPFFVFSYMTNGFNLGELWLNFMVYWYVLVGLVYNLGRATTRDALLRSSLSGSNSDHFFVVELRQRQPQVIDFSFFRSRIS